VKHRFNDNLLAYARVGTSWRPGINVVGDFSVQRSALENRFLILPPETSKSYEIGVKADLLDRRLTLNVAAYQQDFKNYPYRSGSGVQFVEYRSLNGVATPQVGRFNFVAPVPVRVRGFEAELAYAPSDRFNLAANLAYADGKLRNGLVPCNDLNGDGVPDVAVAPPTLVELQAAVGSDNLAACRLTQRSSLGSPWSGNVRAEYNQPIAAGAQGFIRALFSWNGGSEGDPANSFDNHGAYGLLNLYLGVRDPAGAWEVQFFGKNIANDRTVLTVDNGPLQTSYRQISATGAASAIATSPYTQITMVPRREFGVNLRFAFGSR
jgi:iron complex outermembrane receptor protein